MTKSEDRKRRDEIWNTFSEIFGEPKADTAVRLRGSIVNELFRAGANRDEIYRRARQFRARFLGAEITAPALRKWWDELQAPKLASAPTATKEPDKCPHGLWLIAHCDDCVAEGRQGAA